MSSGWEEYSLLDAYDVRNGLTKKREEFGFGAPFVAFKDVFNNHFIPEELDSLANTTPNEQKKYSIKRGDVLITRTSENFEELGMTSVALKDYPAAAYNGFTKRLRPKKGIELKPEYLGFYFRSPYFRRQVLSLTTMTTRASLNNEMLARLKIKVPPAKEQDRIAEVLLSCHKKIHLNQQTNETLEAMAQAIFKSWFVDFNPVRAKIEATSAGRDPNRAAIAAIAGISLEQDWDEIEAALQQKLDRMTEPQCTQLRQTAELFPDELVESEIGEVPKGWEYDQLGNFITVKRGGSPRPIKDFVVEEGLHWTKISDATSENSPFIMTTKEFIKEEGLKKTVLLDKGSLILSNSATPGLPKFLNIDACIHDGWLYFPEKEHFTDLYLYHLFIEIRKALVAKGSGTVFTNLKTDILRNYDVVVPNEEIVNEFNGVARNIFASLLTKREETETLTNLRNTLLPKLISGEVGG